MNEQWRQQLREKMADYRRPAPEVSWDDVYKALDAHQSRRLWLRRLAAAAVLLLIAGGGYWLFQDDEDTAERLTATATNNQQRSQGDSITERRLLCDMADVTKEPSLCDTTSLDSVEASQPTEELQSSNEEVESHIEDAPPSIVEKRTPPPVHPSQVFYPSDFRQRKHLDNRLTAKVYMSNMMNDSYHAESSIRQITNTEIMIHTVYYHGGETTPPSDDPTTPVIVYDTITTVYRSQTDTQIRHRQPIRFGLSLRYRIDNRWSIESGLSYTRLVSDITTITDGQASVTEQRLNYIGLPLNVGYQLWTNRHFGFYVIAGGTIEKMLDASPWQFSLNGAAGAEYRLTDLFSLYTEPGIGYYFSNGSATPTIYQDHPLNFNLSFGLRINIK
jgi:hypothetical protein